MKVGGSFRVLTIRIEQKAGWVQQPARAFEKRNEILTGQVRVVMEPPTTLSWPQQ